MHLDIRSIGLTLAASLVLVASQSSSIAQEPTAGPVMTTPGELPEAPEPQFALAADEGSGAQPVPDQAQSPQPPPPSSAPAQDSSSSQTPAPQTAEEKSAHDKAAEQLKQQEHQRVMGVMAAFNTTNNKDAIPLSAGQKFQLFFKSATDPWPFALAGFVAGIGQADDGTPEWGEGAQGYAKRFGTAYPDYFIGNFFGNAVLPSLLHEDPRYFQKRNGSAGGRALWAASSTVWCKRDKGGWGPNYANVVGNFIGTAIARAYYPSSERTVTDTITDGLTVTAEGIVGAEVIEFWPDLVRHHKRKKAEKLAREAAAKDAQGAAQSGSKSAPAATPENPKN